MTEQNIGQILRAFNNIESKIQEQNGTLRELTAKVNSLENQNKQLVHMIQRLQSAPAQQTELPGYIRGEFQDIVTRSLRSIEDQSRKAIELIKANSKNAKKRAWP